MAPRMLPGPYSWKMDRDEEGHREYQITFRVEGDPRDGPKVIMDAPGLPRPGDQWSFYNDADPHATCGQKVGIAPEIEGEKNKHWKLTYTFSTKNRGKCQDDKVEDPMQEPAKVSGGFVKDKEEATVDRFGRPVMSSSWEQIRGPQVEFDVSRPKVSIEQNVLTYDQAFGLPLSMRDTVNDRPLWGVARRRIRLADVTFERKYYGRCTKYYTRKLEFEVDYNTFDRDILDEGTKVLRGKWHPSTGEWVLKKIDGKDPNPFDPTHFDRFKDRNGENCRVILNGRGLPAGVITTLDTYYLSAPADDADPPDNINKKLNDGDYWVDVAKTELDKAAAGTSPDWAADTAYERGTIVKHNGRLFVAGKQNDKSGISPLLEGGGVGAALLDWREIQAPTNAGFWDAVTEYTAGMYVRPAEKTGIGIRHIEKYRESNFLLLGIPAQL